MSKPLHFQQSFDTPASAVFHALTDNAALGRWFAEQASVSLGDGRYDFWGRFTPVPEGQPGCYAMDDVWSLWLEGLRRHLDGKPVVRCDFSAVTGGDIAQTVEIAAGAAEVWEVLSAGSSGSHR